MGLVDSLQMPGKPRDRFLLVLVLLSLSLSLSLCGEMICCSSTSNPNQTLIQNELLLLLGKNAILTAMVSSCGAVGGPFISCGHFPGGKSNTTMKGGRDSQKFSCLFSIAARKNPSR
jgi:hypothetical protein